jgi:hypothetical protein
MPTVSIAPSIQKALRRITAADQPSSNRVEIKRFMEHINQEIVLTSSFHLGEGVGKFLDSDSEPDDEDPRDAERPSGSSPAPPHTAPVVAAPPPSAQRPARSPASAPPHWYKPPWKSVWKGLLPPARTSPVTTLGDFLPPAWRTAAEQAEAELTGSRDPLFVQASVFSDRGYRDPGPAQQPVRDSGLGLLSKSPPQTQSTPPMRTPTTLPSQPSRSVLRPPAATVASSMPLSHNTSPQRPIGTL